MTHVSSNGIPGLQPAQDLRPITIGGGPFPEVRAIFCGTAGTANIVTAAGNLRTAVPLQLGMNSIRCREVQSGGSASDTAAGSTCGPVVKGLSITQPLSSNAPSSAKSRIRTCLAT